MRRVPFSHKYWITPGFAKKKGRSVTCPETGTEYAAVRCLGNFTALNACTKPPPAHFFFQIPDQRGCSLRFPMGAKRFKYIDLSDAYHTCLLTDSTRDLVVVEFDGDYYQYIGGAQGISQMAVFWPAHLEDGFYTAMEYHWRDMWSGYVDDLGCHGLNDTQVNNRHRILTTILQILKKPYDSKGRDGDDHMILAGLYIDEFGVRVQDEAVEVLSLTLTAYKVKTITDAQHVLGVIQYTNSAFDITPDNWKLFSDNVTILEDAIKRYNATPGNRKAILWGTAEIQACENLNSIIKNSAWAYMRPEDLLGPNKCIVTMTDASDSAVCISVFVVNKANAKDVTSADLRDRNMSQLVGVKRKVLSDSKRRWNTYEAELWALVLVVQYFGDFVSAATRDYPPGNPQGICKIGMWCDSTTAIGQWRSLHLPVGTIDHLSAKARRFYGWADETAGTIYWSLELRHFPGDCISLPHMMTHMADMAKARHKELMAMGSHAIVAPLHVHSFHEPPANTRSLKKKPLGTPPTGFRHSLLNLSPSDVDVVAEALLADNTLYLRVPLHDIYKMAADIDVKSVPQMHRDKISAWIGVRFFAFSPPGSSRSLLYCPISFQLIRATDTDVPLDDLSKTLVMVTPKGAMVRVTDETKQPIVAGEEDHDTHGDVMMHDLRKDIVYAAHNNNNHPSLSRTIKAVREMTWFPEMISFIRYHIDACPICMTNMKIKKTNGCSIVSAQRLQHVQVDHYILRDDLPEITGCAAILTIACNATSMTMFIPVTTTDAEDAIRAIHDRWYCIFGVPTQIKSDRGSAFTSDCMTLFRSIMGQKEWYFSAAANAHQHAMVEHKHEILNHVVSVAHIKGDIRCRKDLEHYAAEATAQQNLYLGEVTPFEKALGEPPRTVQDMAFIPNMPRTMTPTDAALLQQVRTTTAETIALSHEKRAETVRRNLLSADVTSHASKTRVSDIRVGDDVSYKGKPYKVIQIDSHGPAGASKVKIEHSDGSTDTVNAHALTGLAEPTTELMLPRHHALCINDFAFFETDDIVRGGLIRDIQGDNLVMHYCLPAPKQKTRYSPVYCDRNGAETRTRRPKADQSPKTFDIASADIIVRGPITDKGMIDQNMLDFLTSKGIVLFCFSVAITTTSHQDSTRSLK